GQSTTSVCDSCDVSQMSHFYRNSPVSGFTGHVPGARFTVGRRALKTPGREDRERARGGTESSETKDSNGIHNHSISSEELIPRLPLSRSEFALNQVQYQPDYHGASDYHYHAMNQGQGGGAPQPPQGYQYQQPMMYPGMGYPGMGASYGNLPAAYNDSLNSMNYTIGYNAHAMPMRVPRDPTEFEYYQGEQRQMHQEGVKYGEAGEAFSPTQDLAGGGNVQMSMQQMQRGGGVTTANGVETKRRSQSMPRRRDAPPLKDPFEGLDGGVYSKGEVMRNKERRMLAMRGEPVTGKLNYGNGSGTGG
ncbi:hypothetical protein PMAYCL1PPCAC_00075, partial [Pristionchus mayeri]